MLLLCWCALNTFELFYEWLVLPNKEELKNVYGLCSRNDIQLQFNSLNVIKTFL